MSTQHTPGPWKAVRNASFWEVVTPPPGQTLDQANEYSPSLAYVWGEGEEQAEANARLIAAVLDLLEVARSAASMNLHIVPGRRTEQCTCSQCDMVRSARAAIAKAEGVDA